MVHPNKTLATLLATVAGALGVHRFYLRGLRDRLGLAHLASAPLSLVLLAQLPDTNVLFTCAPLVLSALAAFIEALVIGLTPDEKWDAQYGRTTPSASNWPLAVILVLTTGIGAVALIGTIARLFDLLYTGGAYG